MIPFIDEETEAESCEVTCQKLPRQPAFSLRW